MSPWKSRWSRVRLVKTATSNRQPATRSSISACEETSMAAAFAPSRTISASSDWMTVASGVVRSAGSSRAGVR